MTRDDMDWLDVDRLKLLDRIAERLPEVDLDAHEVEWTEMPDDGSQALLVDGGGLDGGNGFTIASHGEDLHAVGSTAPLFPGFVGCIVIGPDGTRRLARVMPDPLTSERRVLKSRCPINCPLTLRDQRARGRWRRRAGAEYGPRRRRWPDRCGRRVRAIVRPGSATDLGVRCAIRDRHLQRAASGSGLDPCRALFWLFDPRHRRRVGWLQILSTRAMSSATKGEEHSTCADDSLALRRLSEHVKGSAAHR